MIIKNENFIYLLKINDYFWDINTHGK